jgi:hypothetical protein
MLIRIPAPEAPERAALRLDLGTLPTQVVTPVSQPPYRAAANALRNCVTSLDPPELRSEV